MKMQLIRNATMKITYAGRTILTDPMLSSKGAFDPFAGIARNPTLELPFQAEEVVKGIESVIVTHGHPDHFDKAASEAIPKEMVVFSQPEDGARMTEEGFQNVIPIETSYTWEGITLTRTGGKHGSGKILELTGMSPGLYLRPAGSQPPIG